MTRNERLDRLRAMNVEVLSSNQGERDTDLVQLKLEGFSAPLVSSFQGDFLTQTGRVLNDRPDFASGVVGPQVGSVECPRQDGTRTDIQFESRTALLLRRRSF